MQSRDIKVDQVYAFNAWRRRNYHDWADESLERVVVASEPRGGTVEVRYGRGGRTRTVNVKSIICTWADHEEALRYKQESRDRGIARMKAARRQIESLLPERFFDDGKRPDAEFDEDPGILSHKFEATVHRDGSFGTEDRLSIHDLAELLQAAYDKGRADAQVGG